MRTEIVKIIQGLKEGDQDMVNMYLEVLKTNYQKIGMMDRDKLFVKRVISLFDDSEEYSSPEVEAINDLENILTNISCSI